MRLTTRRSHRPRHSILAALLAPVAALLFAAPAAQAESLLSETLSASSAGGSSCTSRIRDDASVATEQLSAPGLGSVEVRLGAAAGDWDVAVFDSDTGRVVAGSAYPGSDEIGSGFVADPTDLTVQACRLDGGAEQADVDVEFTAIEAPDTLSTPSFVRVETPTETDRAALLAAGLDVAEHGEPGSSYVTTYGPLDLERIRGLGLSSEVVDPNLLEDSLEIAEADLAAARGQARGGAAQGMPSGQTTYRELFDYTEEMKQLAERNPKIVRLFELKKKTYEGRPVMALEIASNVRRSDGRPTFLQMGVHHAREWPSAEHAIEWAYELVNGWRSGDARVKRLMRKSRTVVVPIVNPDGFETSRSAPSAMEDGREGAAEIPNLALFQYEYHRKNCRIVRAAEPDGTKPRKGEGNCTQQPSTGIEQFGVDPNRNYGGFWGGPGATPAGGTPPGDLAADYRGPGPFSEPETRNVKNLVSSRQVTTLITNHTFSDLVLRPPGLQAAGKPVDEKIYKALGARMAAENGYLNLPSYKLYDTTGGTEDWSYYATGGLGFTFEIGCEGGEPSTDCAGFFHPNYSDTVAQYTGTAPESGEGDGNRAAYFKAMSFAAKPSNHSLLRGRAPAGAKLTLEKRFRTPTSPVINAEGEEGKVRYTKDHLKTSLKVGRSGSFRWSVNPSTRPLVAKSQGRRATGKPSEPRDFSGDPSTALPPCPDSSLSNPDCWNEHAFRVPAGRDVDNFSARIEAEWASPASDWDMEVFRDGNGDGDSQDSGDRIVGSSAEGATSGQATSEQVTVTAPVLEEGGRYVVRMINFAASEPYEGTINFGASPKFVPARTERWKLTCRKGGERSVSRVLVDRGEVKRLDLRRACG